MAGQFPTEFLHGQPVATYTHQFDGEIFGFHALQEVVFAKQRFPIALKGQGNDALYLGQHVTLKGDSRGYIPGRLNPHGSATIVGFAEPFSQGESDHIVKVVESDNGTRDDAVSIKPSNIQEVISPLDIKDDIRIGDMQVGGTRIDLLFTPLKDSKNTHILALHHTRGEEDTVIKIGDNVDVQERGDQRYDGYVTGISVDTDAAGYPDVLVHVSHLDGKYVSVQLVDYHRVTPIPVSNKN